MLESAFEVGVVITLFLLQLFDHIHELNAVVAEVITKSRVHREPLWCSAARSPLLLVRSRSRRGTEKLVFRAGLGDRVVVIDLVVSVSVVAGVSARTSGRLLAPLRAVALTIGVILVEEDSLIRTRISTVWSLLDDFGA